MTRRKTVETTADHPATAAAGAWVITLDDGSQQRFDSEAAARDAHPRAWLRPAREVDDEGDGHDESA